METELNALVFGALREAFEGKPSSEPRIKLDGRTVDGGGRNPHQSLGTLRSVSRHEGSVQTALKSALGQDTGSGW